ncbi:hypothetical protein GCM10023200_16030 [Actinomycetospora chlora]|uniref:Uncharacterized protein n=1 Tax=Actinomycetospora chlora TaxID=663608 RepID=A0ABP9APS4_9PSEU
MTVTDPVRSRVTVASPPAGPAAPHSAHWRDALVDLLVLAEHGDLDAAASLRGWLSVDPTAASATEAIRRVVDAVRAA